MTSGSPPQASNCLHGYSVDFDAPASMAGSRRNGVPRNIRLMPGR